MKTDLTNLDKTALFEFIYSDDSILIELVVGCGFNAVTVLKNHFTFTKEQFAYYLANRG